MVGTEGTGTYGAGLCEFLLGPGIHVVEVDRPRREDRRRGKSDEIDALLAARKVLAATGSRRRAPAAHARRSRRCWSPTALAWSSARGCSTSCRRFTRARRWRCASGSARATAESSGLAFRGCGPAPMGPRQSGSSSLCCATSAVELASSRTQARAYKHELIRLIGSLDPALLDEPGLGPISAAKLIVCDPARLKGEGRLLAATAPHRNPPPRARRSVPGSRAAGTARPTTRSTRSPSAARSTTSERAPTSSAAPAKARRAGKPCAHSNDTSPAASTNGWSPCL